MARLVLAAADFFDSKETEGAVSSATGGGGGTRLLEELCWGAAVERWGGSNDSLSLDGLTVPLALL